MDSTTNGTCKTCNTGYILPYGGHEVCEGCLGHEHAVLALSPICLCRHTVRSLSSRHGHMIEEISFYFTNYNDILKSLAVRQGVIISKRHLIRLLKMHGYSRRQYDDLSVVIDFIMQQLKGNGNQHGYRWMYSKCMKHGIRAKKEDVRLILAPLDSSAMHRSRRLNRRCILLKDLIISGIPIHMENHMESASMVASTAFPVKLFVFKRHTPTVIYMS